MFEFNKNKSKIKLYKQQVNFLKYKYEIFSILLSAFFLISLFALMSFNKQDTSWFHVISSNEPVKNLCGQFGANLAALFFYLWGFSAYLFVFSFIYIAYIFFVEPEGYKKSYRITSFYALTLFVASFFYLIDLDFMGFYPGGLFGSRFCNFLTHYISISGFIILNLSLLFISSIIVFNISFKYLFKLILLTFLSLIQFSFFALLNITKLSFIYLGKFMLYSLNLIWVNIKLGTKYLFNKIFRKNNNLNNFENININNININRENVEQIIDNANVIHVLNLEKFEKFKEKLIFNCSRAYNFHKFSFLLLPNTVFSKNIFSLNLKERLDNSDINNNLTINLNNNKNTKKFIDYILPDLNLFLSINSEDEKNKKQLEEEGILKGKLLEEKLSYFGIKGKVTAIKPGPVITLFEYKPDIDSKISKIIALEDDLALALMAVSIRIVAPIPGRSVVGFEISNKIRQSVLLSDIFKTKEFGNFKTGLPVILGVDVVGNPVIQDLSVMPHLLVAGSTGSGKSVGLNTMIVSLLSNFKPDNLKLILIDPKRLEFAPYKDIPHLLFPIITNPRQASPVLKWLVQEMETRYDKMSLTGARNIKEYQELAQDDKKLESMPYIVLIIDELADLMMVAGKDIEIHIARIAQMARAAGIHMILATQRPSVDVITGLIKVNFPSRIAFRVSSKIDSRTIIDCAGAEKLLGRGDMLYMSSASSDLQRIHGSYVSGKEIEKLASYLRSQAEPEYLDLNETLNLMSKTEMENIQDDLYPDVLDFIQNIEEISISGLQRRYRIGFNRSARIIEKLEMDGLLAPAQGSKPRKILKDNL
ncbi:MAG: FtsK/SpoIIIE family protein [candidate division TM6 bacterium GW2011_GWF2_28_16]|nr:MAG: FtsK/SpoIIIE family protein [candidate division TM6 bacterium GW2011_GWF2_28_16]